MANTTAGTTRALGFGLGVPQQPAIIAVLIGQLGFPPTAPQSLVCRKAGDKPLEF